MTSRPITRFLPLAFTCAALIAQQSDSPASPSPASPLPEKEVESIVQQFDTGFVAAYNSGDPKSITAFYTDDATILAETGTNLVGHAQIENALTAAFASGRKVKMEDTPQKSFSISPDVIVAQGFSHVTPADSPQSPEEYTYTKIWARRGEKWQIAAAQYARPNPWVVTFSATAVGRTSPVQRVKLTNAGPKTLAIRNISLGGKAAPEFIRLSSCSRPVPPAGSCVVSFTFRPKVVGLRKAILWFNDSAGTGPHEIRLIGTGK